MGPDGLACTGLNPFSNLAKALLGFGDTWAEQPPIVKHPRPDVDFNLDTCRFGLLTHPSTIIVEHFPITDENERAWQACEITEEGGDVWVLPVSRIRNVMASTILRNDVGNHGIRFCQCLVCL